MQQQTSTFLPRNSYIARLAAYLSFRNAGWLITPAELSLSHPILKVAAEAIDRIMGHPKEMTIENWNLENVLNLRKGNENLSVSYDDLVAAGVVTLMSSNGRFRLRKEADFQLKSRDDRDGSQFANDRRLAAVAGLMWCRYPFTLQGSPVYTFVADPKLDLKLDPTFQEQCSIRAIRLFEKLQEAAQKKLKQSKTKDSDCSTLEAQMDVFMEDGVLTHGNIAGICRNSKVRRRDFPPINVENLIALGIARKANDAKGFRILSADYFYREHVQGMYQLAKKYERLLPPFDSKTSSFRPAPPRQLEKLMNMGAGTSVARNGFRV